MNRKRAQKLAREKLPQIEEIQAMRERLRGLEMADRLLRAVIGVAGVVRLRQSDFDGLPRLDIRRDGDFLVLSPVYPPPMAQDPPAPQATETASAPQVGPVEPDPNPGNPCDDCDGKIPDPCAGCGKLKAPATEDVPAALTPAPKKPRAPRYVPLCPCGRPAKGTGYLDGFRLCKACSEAQAARIAEAQE